MTKPNPADFSVREFPREYIATLKITGIMSINFEADSVQEARDKANAIAAKIARGEEDVDLEETDDVSVSDVYQPAPMFRVIRNGNYMQVTHLLDGDLPREPDKRGF